ncbi:hypothetical protein PIB30_018530 [Stylosanthes scabra]|uniref:Uncharacterized protein n=1 Tax=Stylosanthes scabra TaxID=79078 RepID=A0ABU6Y8M4_9FABA|nr:hypothetical protein [Stylosanthes scabra]
MDQDLPLPQGAARRSPLIRSSSRPVSNSSGCCRSSTHLSSAVPVVVRTRSAQICTVVISTSIAAGSGPVVMDLVGFTTIEEHHYSQLQIIIRVYYRKGGGDWLQESNEGIVCGFSFFVAGQALVYKLLFSFLNSMCLKWAIELRIATIIHNHGKPITLPHLLSALNLPPSKTWVVPRFMRFLAHNGLFAIVRVHDDNDDTEEEEKEAYALTPASELLVEGTNHCLSSILFDGALAEKMMGATLRMEEWIRGEESSVFETAVGVSFWDLIHKDPEMMRSFNESMAGDSQMVNVALRDCGFVFEGIESVVDVGGGNGTTAKIICEAFPDLQFTVLDLPPVVANFTTSGNLRYVGGDMFESIPQAHAVLLKWVLHDWNDEDCIKILKNCKRSISEKGKVIIIDVVINNEEQDEEDTMTPIKLLSDINMVAMFGAKERSEKEWKQLFIEAGFNNYKIFPIFGFRSLIEVYP